MKILVTYKKIEKERKKESKAFKERLQCPNSLCKEKDSIIVQEHTKVIYNKGFYSEDIKEYHCKCDVCGTIWTTSSWKEFVFKSGGI